MNVSPQPIRKMRSDLVVTRIVVGLRVQQVTGPVIFSFYVVTFSDRLSVSFMVGTMGSEIDVDRWCLQTGCVRSCLESSLPLQGASYCKVPPRRSAQLAEGAEE